MPTVYLAGPEVFFSDGRALIDRKAAIARDHGLHPVTPAELGEAVPPADAYERGVWISERNEELIRRADLCIANLTPFRGVSADPGTVFEVAFAVALGKPVFAHTNDPRDYGARVMARRETGEWMSGRMVEEHGMTDNLMIEGAIARRGWEVVRASTVLSEEERWIDLEAYTRCVMAARAAV